MKRMCAGLLVVLLVLGVLPFSAFGAEEVTVAQKAAELENKYGITIQYPTVGDSPIITVGSLEILDMALDNVTPAVVRQVSSYYERKNGIRLTYSYKRSTRDEAAGFSDERSLIELYFPESGNAVSLTGENPLSIVHEFGHAFHLMVVQSYGLDRMRSEWSAFNGDIGYQAGRMENNPDKNTFITAYASTDFYEDVAETFAHVLVRGRAGQGFKNRLTSGGVQTGLGKKVAYVEQMIAAYANESAAILANYQQIYSAATSISYQSMKFSGEYLQYSGYPQPRYMLSNALGMLGWEKDQAAWIRAIGGWYVKTTEGKEIIIFPSGEWCDVGSKFISPFAAS